jgi:carbon storage regulator CsrA
MLVLRRKESEQILIGKDIVVTVSRIRGNRVQLAISAPKGVRILRAEMNPFESMVPVSPERQLSG